MPWLLRDEQVLAALEVAEERRERMRGLLGRDGIDGALLLRPGKSVHSFGMRFPLDVAFGSRGGPRPPTDGVTLASGREQRNPRRAHSHRRYEARRANDRTKALQSRLDRQGRALEEQRRRSRRH